MRLAALVRNVVVKGVSADGTRIDLEDVDSRSGRVRNAAPAREGDGLLIEPGDVLFAKLRPYLRKSLLASQAGACSPEFLVLRPGTQLESRFLAYVVQSASFASWAVSSSDGAKMPRTSFEKLREARVAVPEVDEQLATVDFLDAETARIDALVSSRVRQRQLLSERHAAFVAKVISAAGPRTRLASAVAAIEQGASPRCADRPAGPGECGILKLSAVNESGFSPDENKFLADDLDASRVIVRDGDLLVTRANTPALVGLAAVVRLADHHITLLLPDLIYRLTLRDGHDPEYVRLAISTADARGQLTAAARGSSQSMVKLRGEDLRELRVALPSPERQRSIASATRSQSAAVRRTLVAIDRQIALLCERREALITGAVTGRLQVPDTSTANAGA